MTTEIIRPWPGPKPYREEDAGQFFGREDDIGQIRSSILTQRLTLLLAGSGVGKTSLLQAGVIPQLRELREQEPGVIGPVILVRQWGLPGSPEVAFVEAVRKEVEVLGLRREISGERFQNDIGSLLAVPVPELTGLNDPFDLLDEAVGYVHRLTASVGRLVLIVDQAEELLGSGLGKRNPVREKRALDLFSNIFRRVNSCHVMLSLREEYRARLSPLGRSVDGLEKRQAQIQPLARDEVREAVKAAAESVEGVRIASTSLGTEESVLDTVFGWLQSDEEGAGIQSESIDLLRLQALLVEVFEHARNQETRNSGEGQEVVIDAALLADFQKVMVEAAGRELNPTALGQQALERYIDRALAGQETRLDRSPPGLIRRLVVRMAPWLSSPGGFKRHNREDDLVFNAIRSDLDILRATSSADDVRKAIQEFKGCLAIEYDPSGGEQAGSGWGWSRDQSTIGSQLAQTGFYALEILKKEEILKSSEGEGEKVYELIHDGFGPALNEWSDRRRKDIADTVSSIVSQCGESFLWAPRSVKEMDLQHVRWLGCNLNGFKLKGVTFRDSDLRGTIFLDCDLEECQFIDCDLDGLVFKGGAWRNVRWQGCEGRSTLFAGMTFMGTVVFKDCRIENASFEGVSVEGSLEARSSSLRFAQIQSLGNPGHVPELIFRNCDLTNALIEDLDTARRVDCLGEDTVLKTYNRSPMGPHRERGARTQNT